MKPTRMYMNNSGDSSFQATFDSHRLTFSNVNFTASRYDLGTCVPPDKQENTEEIVTYDGGGVDGFNCNYTSKDTSSKERLLYDEVVYYDGGGVEGYGNSEKN